MKEIIKICRVIQSVTALIATIAFTLLATTYEQSTKVFLTLCFIFLVAFISSLITNFISDIALHKLMECESDKDVHQRSCNAVYCNYTKDGKYLYERK